MLETLLKLGLSDKEAKVYLATLELGKDTVQNIGQKAKVNRATTYVILEKLLKLGLVSQHDEGKKTMFVAEDPHELVNILEEQKRQIDAKKQYLDASLNELMAIYNARTDKPSVRYFEGADGLESLDRYGYDRFLVNTEVNSVMPVDIIERQFPTRRKSALSDRVKHKIQSKVIYTRDEPFTDEEDRSQMREGMYMPREEFPLDVTIQVYPKWGVKFFNFDPKNYFGVLIQSPDIARNMKLLFDLAWEGVKARKAHKHDEE